MTNPIYTNDMRVFNAQGFLSNVSRVSPSPEYLYAFIAKNTPWSYDSNGAAVETPIDPTGLFSDELTTRSEMQAIKRINASSIAHVVPRHDWTTGTVYTKYTTSNASLPSSSFYVVTDDNYVYKCIDNNSGAQSTVKPTGTSTSNITLADGYVWKFMYDVPSSMVATFMTSSWLPVPVGGQKSTLQTAVETAASYSVGGPVGGHGSNAYEELYAYRLMVVIRFEGTESGVFPVSDTYRKVGLFKNPELVGGGSATGSVYVATSDSATEIDVNTGNVIYVEHIAPVTRNASQNEDYKLIVEF